MKKSWKNTLLLIAFVLVVAIGIASIFLFSYFRNGGNGLFPGGNTPDITYNPDVKLEDGTNMETPYRESNETHSTARFTYQDINEANHAPVTPSKGDVNILVVPVEFNEEVASINNFRSTIRAFTNQELSAIDVTFNGDENGSNPYWYSVSEYYRISSYGNLNLNFDITDPFTPSISASEFLDLELNGRTGIEGSSRIIEDIFIDGTTIDGQNVDYSNSRYDSNDDGFFDGVWLIYNCNDYKFVHSKYTPFWAYTTDFDGNGNVYSTRYANCALSFLYDDSTSGYDAHTIIHETGHMLGLDDYYSYDNDFNYGYLGGVDMMDLNVGDHSSFSKYSLGWIKPTIIYEEETTITLNDFSQSGDALIIPSSYFNDSAFSEYLILEFKTPHGLNTLDYEHKYQGEYPKTFGYGLAIYHVDARLALHNINLFNSTYSVSSYLDVNASSVPEISLEGTNQAKAYMVANSNTPSYNAISEDYALVKLVSKGSTLYNQDDDHHVSFEANTGRDLYQEGDSFGSSQIRNYFPNGSFNNGTPINDISITVNSMNENSITLTISR